MTQKYISVQELDLGFSSTLRSTSGGDHEFADN